MLKLHIQKYILIVFTSVITAFPSIGQELIEEGKLADIEYDFTGPKQYKANPGLVHALAYANDIDVGGVQAKKIYHVSYTVKRIEKGGFQTQITLKPQQPEGHLSFYQFYSPHYILPELQSVKLFVTTANDEFIYVKPIEHIITNNNDFVFTFRHQRFAKDWVISLRNHQWKHPLSIAEFNEKWVWINDYQSAAFLLQAYKSLNLPTGASNIIIYKQRWLSILRELETSKFYQEIIEKDKRDPLELAKDLGILKYLLAKEIEQLQSEARTEAFDMQGFSNAYEKPEVDIFNIALKDVGLYSNLYLKLNKNDEFSFCIRVLDSVFGIGKEDDRKQFEHLYQQYNLQKISKLIEDKQPNWALFQIEKFESFYQYTHYLKESATFRHFKSKAVYDIYLSYIEVARQAIEKNRIELSMNYLDKATLIQQKYPKEIINDIYVDKELKKLIKIALERYLKMMERGEVENAKKVKKGILGLIKRYQLDMNIPVLKTT